MKELMKKTLMQLAKATVVVALTILFATLMGKLVISALIQEEENRQKYIIEPHKQMIKEKEAEQQKINLHKKVEKYDYG